MRKIYIMTVIAAVIMLSSCTKRYVLILESAFGIDIPELKYSIIKHDEHWYLNGDGNNYAQLSLKQSSFETLKLLKKTMLDLGARPIVEANYFVYDTIKQATGEISINEGYFLLKPVNPDNKLYDGYYLLIYLVDLKQIVINYTFS